MILQHSSMRNSLRWHVIVINRDFSTELFCNTIIHLLSRYLSLEFLIDSNYVQVSLVTIPIFTVGHSMLNQPGI